MTNKQKGIKGIKKKKPVMVTDLPTVLPEAVFLSVLHT